MQTTHTLDNRPERKSAVMTPTTMSSRTKVMPGTLLIEAIDVVVPVVIKDNNSDDAAERPLRGIDAVFKCPPLSMTRVTAR